MHTNDPSAPAAAEPALFSSAGPRVFTIPPGRPFLDDLARAIRTSAGGAPEALSDITVFLPTRRAARALGEAFLRLAGPAPAASLLPAIRPLGDVDEDELAAAAHVAEDDAALPPAVSPHTRRLALARFVAARDRALRRSSSWAAALAGADALSKLLDSLYTENVDLERFKTLAPEQFAAHWGLSLEFLEIVTREWPEWLAAQGLIDPAERRRRLIEAMAARWEKTPPKGRVVAAGSTGSMPAVARLMHVIANELPRGAVVLPGLDTALDIEAWGQVDDPHPQSGLKRLLKVLETDRLSVHTLSSPAPDARRKMLSLALRPARATGDWLARLAAFDSGGGRFAEAVDGLSLVEAADEEAEAAAIALLLRETLETPDKTAMLVTPDRTLARRVSARLARWNIRADDSAGRPFANTRAGVFLRLTARWLADPGDPAALAALLKHPLTHAGIARADLAHRARRIDLDLRGLRPGEALADLGAKIGALETDKAWLQDERARALALIAHLEEIAAAHIGAQESARAFLDATIDAAEALAIGDDTSPDELWTHEDGETGAALLAELREAVDLLGEARREDWPDLFDALIAGAPVRTRTPGHPRLLIVGPLEARLQSADRIILGGLNEGAWPTEAEIDPFLSRPMRAALGLPSPERRIGLAAHDFMALACAPEAILTRAQRQDRKPATPSRWIVRLKNILSKKELLAAIDRTGELSAWAAALDAPARTTPAQPPAPRPPAGLRPRRLSVTRIETLMRDPYAIYGQYVLRLKKLDPLNQEPDARIRGTIIHTVAERLSKEHPEQIPDDAEAILERYANEEMARALLPRAVRALWRPRMAKAFHYLARWEREQRETGRPAVIEDFGEWRFAAPGGDFTVFAKADRIDALAGGGCAVYDFKSGDGGTKAQMLSGLAPQLPLEAVIAEKGGYAALDPAHREVRRTAYIRLNGANEGGEERHLLKEADLREVIDRAQARMPEIVTLYDDPQTPYSSQLRPRFEHRWPGDYDVLARRKEWSVEDGDDA